MYTELDHVNKVLRLLGERPVNSLDTPHPRVASIRASLGTASMNAQSLNGGWWFNIEYPTFEPQLDKRIALPNDTLTVDAVKHCPAVAQRGRFLYNLDKATFEFDSPVRVRLTRLLAFDLLPVEARRYVSAEAALEVIVGIDADGSKRGAAETEIQKAYTSLHAQHIRSQQANLLATPSMAEHMRNIRGTPGIASLGESRYG